MPPSSPCSSTSTVSLPSCDARCVPRCAALPCGADQQLMVLPCLLAGTSEHLLAGRSTQLELHIVTKVGAAAVLEPQPLEAH